ncbi:FABP family protein [Janibacter anophelis]|uniref:FABP family protein n=1 Tax=Janibacter anophelis TaxID=319054 RepID=UPI000DEF6FF6|nr:FABP family protein [Janibacter anophelis]
MGRVFTLDPTIHPDIAPLAWLVGRWEGAGVLGYPTIESANFGQEIVVSHDTRPFLRWESQSWILDDAGNKVRPSGTELGFWRPAGEGEAELLLTHPTGIVELYYGTVEPGRIELQTDGVLRSPHAKDYTAAKRMYGLVQSNLMWVMDMAAMGQPLTSHLSAELKRVD